MSEDELVDGYKELLRLQSKNLLKTADVLRIAFITQDWGVVNEIIDAIDDWANTNLEILDRDVVGSES